MNKKFGILFVFVLLVGTVFLSACQSEVGAKVNKNLDGGVQCTLRELTLVNNNRVTNGLKFISADYDNERCVIEYLGLSYTFNLGDLRTMPNGAIIGVAGIGINNDRCMVHFIS